MSVISAKTPARSAAAGLSKKVIVPIVLVAAAALAYVGYRSWGSGGPVVVGSYYTIEPMTMDIKVIEKGELQAVHNIDISCQVEGLTAITWVVKEGATVKKGETVLTLDSSVITQKLEDATLDLQRAQADLTASEEQLGIQKGTNDANLLDAQVKLTLAQLDLQQYTEGVYPQMVAEAQRAVQMSQISLDNKQDDLKQVQSLFSKGFMTSSDVKKAELDVLTAGNDLAKKTTDLKVMTTYTHKKDLTSKKNALAQAESSVERVKAENSRNLALRVADVNARKQSQVVRQRRVDKLQEQLASCKIVAPADGMVVYASSFDRRNDTPIQEGTQVRERQLLLRLPDTAQMKAVLNIQENQVPKLAVGQPAVVKIVGVPHPVQATLSRINVLADNSNRWWSDARQYPVDLTLNQTPDGLKPGVGVEKAEILVNRIEGALAVPLTSIYSAGGRTFVFVHQGDHDQPREITLGATNETYAQVTRGVDEGTQVRVLQIGEGQDLLEKAGIRITPTKKSNKAQRPEDAAGVSGAEKVSGAA